MRSERLQRGFANGDIVPGDAPVLLLFPSQNAELPPVPLDQLVVVQPSCPDFNYWSNQGLNCHSSADGLEPASMGLTIVYMPRSRALASYLIDLAESCTWPGATVVLDGNKVDGVEGMIKQLAKRRNPAFRLSKSHGKTVGWTAERHPKPKDEAVTLAEGWVTKAGLFSADAPDPGSCQLLKHLPALHGRVADLGAGWGFLSASLLRAETGITSIDLVEADARALEAARINLANEARGTFLWEDATSWRPGSLYDFVITNPPFHASRRADPGLGQAFIETAAKILKPKGTLYLVANTHLPYEAHLQKWFGHVTELSTNAGFKTFAASRPRTKPV